MARRGKKAGRKPVNEEPLTFKSTVLTIGDVNSNGEAFSMGALDHFGTVVTLAPVNIPVHNIKDEKVGVITRCEIKHGRVEFTAMVKDTPEMREALGITAAAASMGCKL